MRSTKNYAILSLIVTLLVFASTASGQKQDPPEPSPKCSPPGQPTPKTKFVKRTTNVIPDRYIVVLCDDVVSDDAPLEVRRAGVTAIAERHAQTYGGKFDYVYETALKGYAINLPNEDAAIEISKLPEVRWVEQDSNLSLGVVSPPSPELRPPGSKWNCSKMIISFTPY